MNTAIARVMDRIARLGYATLENAALIPNGAPGLDAEILVLYVDRRFVRLIRRILIDHTASDAVEVVIPISCLANVLERPIFSPILHSINA